MSVPFDQTATIAASGTLSGKFILEYPIAVNLLVPTFTSAPVSFQVCVDAVAFAADQFFNLFDELGQEVQIPAGTHNVVYSVPSLVGVYGVKIRSGLSGDTTAQASARTMQAFGLR